LNTIKITAVNSQAIEIENEEDWTERFIQVIQGKPAIYNKRLKEHSDRNITTRMWSEVCEAMIPSWHGLTSQEKTIKGEIIYMCVCICKMSQITRFFYNISTSDGERKVLYKR
jgi:hypothetical protein